MQPRFAYPVPCTYCGAQVGGQCMTAGGQPAQVAHTGRVLAARAAGHGPPLPPTADDSLAVMCPHCGAVPGAACVRITDGAPRATNVPHLARQSWAMAPVYVEGPTSHLTP